MLASCTPRLPFTVRYHTQGCPDRGLGRTLGQRRRPRKHHSPRDLESVDPLRPRSAAYPWQAVAAEAVVGGDGYADGRPNYKLTIAHSNRLSPTIELP